MYSKSLFLFSLQKEVQNVEEYESVVSFGEYQIKYCKTVPMMYACTDGRELLIYGYAVDVLDGIYENLADRILRNTETIEDIINFEAHLGGKYLLIYKDAADMYAIPDASASIPFCYSTGDTELVCASNCEYVAKQLFIHPDEQLLKIRQNGELSQAMPYNLTIYKEIEQLLPNHYFIFGQRKPVRFVNSKKHMRITSKEAAEITAPMIENILKLYADKFKLYCPITSGRDSRAVLAFMLSIDPNTETYTINHSTFAEDEPDVLVPAQIAQAANIVNKRIADIQPDDKLCNAFDKVYGKTGYSKRTLMIANTIHHSFSDGAVINGDIIGQVGKCSLHRDIPERLATARYFRCKLHNYSKASLSFIRKWMRSIRQSGEQTNLFDLFSMESRMGRWAAQENLVYAMVGQHYLNIFNSRAIVYTWTQVSRSERKFSKLHTELICLKGPFLHEIPYEGMRSTYEKLAKKNGLTYYFASFAKYYIQKFQFKRRG